jgi:predicted secreted protein
MTQNANGGFSGRLLLAKIGDGAVPTESFTALGGVRDARFSLRRSLREATDVQDGGWRTLSPATGITSMLVQLQGRYEDLAADNALRVQALGGTRVNYQLRLSDGSTLSAPMVVARYDRYTNAEEEWFSTELESAGAVVFA